MFGDTSCETCERGKPSKAALLSYCTVYSVKERGFKLRIESSRKFKGGETQYQAEEEPSTSTTRAQAPIFWKTVSSYSFIAQHVDPIIKYQW